METTDKDLRDDRTTQIAGGTGLGGCALAAFADLLGARLSDRIGLASDTISDLAAGRYDWIADAGLYAFVAAVLAVALGLGRWRISGWDWTVGKMLLVVIAADVTAIAAYEAYNRPGGGPDLHMYFVYLLGIAFPAMVWLTSRGLAELAGWLKWALRIFAVAWALAGPVLFLIPTEWDGFYERGLAVAMMAWFAMTGWLLWANTSGRPPGDANA